MITWFPINTLGWIIVFSPIIAELEILSFDALKGLKYVINLLKSRKGSSEINNDLPNGHSTFLLIRIVVAAEFKALS